VVTLLACKVIAARSDSGCQCGGNYFAQEPDERLLFDLCQHRDRRLIHGQE
jgi:hypothetical protein